MTLHTCSEVISFARELENGSAEFYGGLCQKYSLDGDVLLSFVTENKKSIVTVERAYYGVITDAIEGCYAFDIDPDEYMLQTELPANAGYAEALGRAIEIENTVVKFYSDAAEQSRPLMADVPRAFALIVKKRVKRLLALQSLLNREA